MTVAEDVKNILVERITQTTERYQKVNVYIITRAKNISIKQIKSIA